MSGGRPPVLTPEQSKERSAERKRRLARAQTLAKTTLAHRYPEEYEVLWREHFAQVHAERGPLPHQDLLDAQAAARPHPDLQAAQTALKAVEKVPGMEDAAARLREQIAQMQG